MTTAPQNRVHAGVPDGGQFARTAHSDNVPVLGAPSVSPEFVTRRLDEAGFTAHMSDAEIERVTAALNASRDFRDENITAVADQVHLDSAGHTVTDAVAAEEGLAALTRLGREDWVAALRRVQGRQPERTEVQWPGDTSGSISGDMLRNAVDQMAALPDGKTAPVQENDPRLQAGEVFDKVKVGDTVFTRAALNESINDPYEMRFQANRPLTDQEAYALSGVVGYANRAAIGGEPMDDPAKGPYRDTPYSFVVNIDTTKGRRRDYGEFENMVASIVRNGTAPRVSRDNTRAIEPFEDPNLQLEIYYGD